MNWLNEQYANERYQQARRDAERATEINALLADSQTHAEQNTLRQALGGKLIEWGKRLQETANTPQHLEIANS